MAADPAIVETWVKGWTLARATPPPVWDAGAFRVDVGWPEQQARYVFSRLDEQVRNLAERIADPWIYVKVCALPDEVGPVPPPRWVVQPSSFMMISDLESAALAPPPDGYVLSATEAEVAEVRVLDRDGDQAASGHMVVVDDFAIYDRIETHPDHRRRGLGRTVMEALADIGRRRGATRGLLVATADGRALYERIGWTLHSPYTSAVIPSA